MDELDELRLKIARAKGWTFQQDAPEGYQCIEFGNHSGWWVSPDGKDAVCARCQMETAFPEWPTEIAAAWELVEEMGESGVNIYWGKKGCIVGLWKKTFFAPTAPEAICRAWLAWKEAQP